MQTDRSDKPPPLLNVNRVRADTWRLRAGYVAAIVFFLATAVLFARSAKGHLASSIDVASYLAISAIGSAAGLAIAVLLLPQRDGISSHKNHQRSAFNANLGVRIATVCSVVAWVVAASLPGASTAAGTCAAGIASLPCIALLVGLPRPAAVRNARPGRNQIEDGDSVDIAPSPTQQTKEPSAAWQRMTRCRHGEEDIAEGWVRVEIQAGQRRESAHLAFCPPFADIPKTECEVVGDVEAQVVAAETFVHGMRLEVSVARTFATPSDVTVGFRSVAPHRPVNRLSEE